MGRTLAHTDTLWDTLAVSRVIGFFQSDSGNRHDTLSGNNGHFFLIFRNVWHFGDSGAAMYWPVTQLELTVGPVGP